MPQVHNRSLSMDQDSSAFNKNSRYMASLRLADASTKRVNVLNALEKRMENVKTMYLKRETGAMFTKMDRVKERLMDNLNKRLAYKLVLKQHPIENSKDYSKALNRRYTIQSMENEIRLMMLNIKPDALRKQKAQVMVAMNRKRYDNILKQNWDEIERRFPVKKWRPYGLPSREKTREALPTPTPEPAILARNKRALATLRRRVISIDSPKPESPLKLPSIEKMPSSPVRTPRLSKTPSSTTPLPKKQGITMSMMKKQKSFLDNAEKSDIGELYKPSEAIVPIEESKQSARSKVDTSRSNEVNGVDDLTELTTKMSVLPPINRNQSANSKGSEPVVTKAKKRMSLQGGEKIKLPSIKMAGGK